MKHHIETEEKEGAFKRITWIVIAMVIMVVGERLLEPWLRWPWNLIALILVMVWPIAIWMYEREKLKKFPHPFSGVYVNGADYFEWLKDSPTAQLKVGPDNFMITDFKLYGDTVVTGRVYCDDSAVMHPAGDVRISPTNLDGNFPSLNLFLADNRVMFIRFGNVSLRDRKGRKSFLNDATDTRGRAS